MTHEEYIAQVRDAVIKTRPLTEKQRSLVTRIKLVYGHDKTSGTRGFTCHAQWLVDDEATAVVQVCLNAEESLLQLAGTTIHELGHVVAGHEAGHGPVWKNACRLLGLEHVKAVGTDYHNPVTFNADMLVAIKKIPEPTDGNPHVEFHVAGMCGQGIGTRGGKSRGKGSGSRIKKVECPRCGYLARVTKKWIEVGLPTCPCGMKMIDEGDKQ